MPTSTILFLLAAVGLAGSTILNASFNDFIQEILEELHVPGLSLAVVLPGGVIEAKGYGYAKLPGTPATADTLWFTGSTTKAFTAAAMAKVVADTKSWPNIKWTSKLSDLLTGDFVLRDEYATAHVTLEDALSHRTGLPGHDNAYGWNNASAVDSLRSMRYLPLSAEPRTRYQYNNLMFTAVGDVLRRLTGKSVEYVLREWLWEPLGMHSTTFSIAEARQGSLARGYYWAGDHYVPDSYVGISPIEAAGGTISSVQDYALWVKALLDVAGHNEAHNHSSPLDSALWQAITAPRSIVADATQWGPGTPTYALGWHIENVGPFQIVTHSGGVLGFGTQVFLVPDKGLGVVTAANTLYTGATAGQKVFQEILKMVLEYVDTSDAKVLQRTPTGGNVRLQQQPRTKKNNIPYPSEQRYLPLPGEVKDLVGTYAHPGYGTINISLAWDIVESEPRRDRPQIPFRDVNNEREILLQASLSPRTWTRPYFLWHKTHLSFDGFSAWVHGPYHKDADGQEVESCVSDKHYDRKDRVVACKNEIALEKEAEMQAVFELGLDGVIERVGIEAENEMMDKVEDWRDGMIWFWKGELDPATY